MKAFCRSLLTSLLLLSSLPAISDDSSGAASESLIGDLVNLGYYLGFDITQNPTSGNAPPISQALLTSTTSMITGGPSIFNTLFNTLLGAIPVNAFQSGSSEGSTASLFVPNDKNQNYSLINGYANHTFTEANYSSGTSQQISVSALMDQQTYQQDPVNQAILDILGTPDTSYCLENSSTDTAPLWSDKCSTLTKSNPSPTPLYNLQVMTNVLGALPHDYEYYSYDYNSKFLSQLNSNTLIAPLLYSTESSTTTTSSNQNTPSGLPGETQAQLAEDFIRYATGAVIPLQLPAYKDYDALFTQANGTATDPASQALQMKAQGILANYLLSVRMYAAQTSVGLSNLYYILSKRMPQSPLSGSGNASSQALSEFTMATWRLFNPADNSQNTQWIGQINNASPTTVQKEMVTLLAEINYQLYLNRQQEERLLLTNTMLLLQSTRAGQPIASSLAGSNAAAQ